MITNDPPSDQELKDHHDTVYTVDTEPHLPNSSSIMSLHDIDTDAAHIEKEIKKGFQKEVRVKNLALKF
jgi:hypothetical protein